MMLESVIEVCVLSIYLCVEISMKVKECVSVRIINYLMTVFVQLSVTV